MTKKELLQDYEAPVVFESEDAQGIFEHYWYLFVDSVVERDNFKDGHLEQLKILCKLYKDEQALADIIDIEGYTFSSEGRNGFQVRPRPEVAQLKNIRSQIKDYSKMLGIVLTEDKKLKEDPDDDWG